MRRPTRTRVRCAISQRTGMDVGVSPDQALSACASSSNSCTSKPMSSCVRDGHQPLLVEPGRSEDAAVDSPKPAQFGRTEVGALVVAVVAHRSRRPSDRALDAEPDSVGRQFVASDDLVEGVQGAIVDLFCVVGASSVQISSTAAAAAITSGLPLYVPKCHMRPSLMVAMMSARPPKAARATRRQCSWPG